MRRLLIVVLSLAMATTALAAPAYACVAAMSAISSDGHTCCDEPALMPAPAGPCCAITAPVQRIANTDSRQLAPDQQMVVLPRAGHGEGFDQRDVGRKAPAPVLRGSTVPLYLQQLALLI